jgi:hypothetical protein
MGESAVYGSTLSDHLTWPTFAHADPDSSDLDYERVGKISAECDSIGKDQAMFHCANCNHLESDCSCDRYCVLCQSDDSVRLCEDGFYYCRDCREACDLRTDS